MTGATARVNRLYLPERSTSIGESVRSADQALRRAAGQAGILDTTHFDTVRFPPPAWARESFDAAARDGSLAYTAYRGHGGVRRQLAISTAALTGAPVDPEVNVVITPGTQAGLFAALSALAEEGVPVAIADPDYLFTQRIIRFLGAGVHPIPLTLSPAGPRLDLEELRKAFTIGVRVLVISNPHNPTGGVFEREVLAGVARLAVEFDATVIVDELYCRLVYEGEFVHLRSLPGMAERTVTLLGPSKTESLSGYRVGVVLAPQSITDGIEDVLSIMSLRAPAYAQHLLTHWLVDDGDWVQERRKQLARLRTSTIDRLQKVDGLKLAPQRGTAYVFPNVSVLGATDQEVSQRLLTDAKVLISPGYQFGANGVGSFRLCYAREEVEWAKALDRIVEVLDRMRNENA